MSCPGALRHQDSCSQPGESSRCCQNEITQLGYGASHAHSCKEGLFRNHESCCRYHTIQFCLVPFKALPMRIWQEDNKEGKIRGKESFQSRRGWITGSLVRNEGSRAQVPKCSSPHILKAKGSCAPMGRASLQNGLRTSSGIHTTCWAAEVTDHPYSSSSKWSLLK